jgi:hypothetical protein
VRVVETRALVLKTSVGEVTGEICSDLTVALGIDGGSVATADADGSVSSVADVTRIVARVGVPRAEAERLVEAWWQREVAPVWTQWVEREHARTARKQRRRSGQRRGA